LDDAGKLARRKKRVDASVIQAGSFTRAATLLLAGIVLHENGVVIEAPKADRAQQVREPIGACVEVGVSHCFAGLGHDEGRLLCTCEAVLARIHFHALCTAQAYQKPVAFVR
jgi:hypothetical protein